MRCAFLALDVIQVAQCSFRAHSVASETTAGRETLLALSPVGFAASSCVWSGVVRSIEGYRLQACHRFSTSFPPAVPAFLFSISSNSFNFSAIVLCRFHAPSSSFLAKTPATHSSISLSASASPP